MKDQEKYFEANKALWDQKTPIHLKSEFYDNEAFKNTLNSLKEIELKELPDLKGKSVLHLQCHFGQDSISLANLGAKVTAIDLSPKAIEAAKILAYDVNIEVNFIECNVYDVDKKVSGEFDIVFASYGTICWLPDLRPWAEIISKKLKPNGSFYFVEFHPFVDTLNDEYTGFGYPYFNTSQLQGDFKGTYADTSANIEANGFFWNHPISDVFNRLTEAGLEFKFLNEYDFSPWPCFPNLIEEEPNRWRFKDLPRIPLVYSLLAKKK